MKETSGRAGLRITSGFTLVELLIVITLIVILSVAMVATINPIQQINKARDARYLVVAAELLGALERYYSAPNLYPWNVTAYDNGIPDGKIPIGSPVGLSSTDRRLGVISKSDGTSGALVSTLEIKSSFAGERLFQPSAGLDKKDKIYVYSDGEFSVFDCFCPRFMGSRIGENARKLKCLAGYDSNAEKGLATSVVLLDVDDFIMMAGSKVYCRSSESGSGVEGVENANFCNPGFSTGGVGGGEFIANMQCVPDGMVTLD